MRQGQEHHIVSGQHLDLGGFQDPLRQWQQMRVVLGQGCPGTGGGGQGADGQPAVGISGVAEQQAQDLPTGIPTGAGNRHRSHDTSVHYYALHRNLMP